MGRRACNAKAVAPWVPVQPLGLVYKTTSRENGKRVIPVKRGKLNAYNVKIIETPYTKEVWIYDSPILYQTKKEKALEPNTARKNYDELSAMKQYDSLKRKQLHYKQMRWTISRLVDCNFDIKTKFMTLTFQDNISEITYTNMEFSKFIKRLTYHIYNQKRQILKYIATWEKQKRGAIHYHIIFFDFPYIQKKQLEDIWGHGFVHINQIDVDSRENRGRYVSKYFMKDLELKEHKQKAFFKSQNLKHPTEQRLALDDASIAALTEHETVVFSKEYDRTTYISEMFRTDDNEPGSAFHDTPVRYLKIKK